ncbi:N-alpha-acetyltransferase 40 [Histomonas meleagridis]|uniref:N-alpha-acetyltransferase 40 n=1 Tax=Histomonas meleagridis TaxID=135588 RepID=UPI0035593EB8|nr:N-alpha-acetyltransferase 40 [Histomonas meleagridis]KAH0798517.1 N-alpha-acetyltransferase 40 [Histomonas meleagridis]
MSKAKLRRQKIKEETEMLNNKRQLIREAEACEDLLADIPMFKNFNKNGLKCTVKSYIACPDEYKDWVFNLTSRHMKTYYENTWGWSDKNKRTELFEESSRYLIAIDDQERPIGFIHIRFEFELKETTLYVYELQIEDEFQRKGLGLFLMQAAEFIALKKKMESVMLTVFKENTGARAFYRKLHYKLHPSSPEISYPEDPVHDHEILFKPLVKAKQ